MARELAWKRRARALYQRMLEDKTLDADEIVELVDAALAAPPASADPVHERLHRAATKFPDPRRA